YRTAIGSCVLHAAAIDIEAIGLVAHRRGQPQGQLADQAESDDADTLAWGELQPADALHGDAAQGAKGGMLGGHVVGKGNGEVSRNGDIFGMTGEASTHAGHSLACREVEVPVRLEDDAGAAISKRRMVAELALNGFPGAGKALALNHRPDLLHLFGRLAGLLVKTHHSACPGYGGTFRS